MIDWFKKGNEKLFPFFVPNWHCTSGTVLVPTGVNLIGRTETLVNKGSITSGRCAGKPARAAVLS
jgi:hypothetical protein